jgi:hypothetical protein
LLRRDDIIPFPYSQSIRRQKPRWECVRISATMSWKLASELLVLGRSSTASELYVRHNGSAPVLFSFFVVLNKAIVLNSCLMTRRRPWYAVAAENNQRNTVKLIIIIAIVAGLGGTASNTGEEFRRGPRLGKIQHCVRGLSCVESWLSRKYQERDRPSSFPEN